MQTPAPARARPVESRGGSMSRSWPHHWLLAAVLLAAAAIRLGYLIELWRSPLFLLNTLPGLDMATYYSVALGLASGTPPHAALFQAPLYPVVLSAVIRLTGPSVATLTAAQVLLGALACALLFELGRRLASREVGLLASALYAAYPLAWYYGGLLLSENVLVVLALGLVLSAARAFERDSTRAWLSTAVLCGLATLTKPNLGLVLPVLMVAAVLVRPKSISARQAALACVAFSAVLLPAIAFNSLAAGEPRFVSGQGSHLWLAGNSAYSTGLYQLPCGPALAAWDPSFWLLQGRKLVLFFSNEEFGNNTWVGVFRSYVWLPLPLVGFGVPAALGLVGLAAAGPWSRRWLALVLVLATYAAGIIMFVVVGRYRLAAVALLCVPAATLLAHLPQLVREHPRRVLVTATAVVLLSVAANVNLPPDVSVPFAHANAATVFAAAGDTATAQSELARARAARLAIEAQDPHGCSQVPAFDVME